ncbi:MAG: aminoglycoside phosphotransferase family protein [Anaerolineaceae bacterium]|nr:aminoglycoside phosphotransferase family protein [Anaerolineaceae bacterium]
MEELIRAICAQEKIPASEIRMLTGGQVNRVYGVDERYVVRVGRREDAFQRLRRETDLLRSLEGQIPVPRVYAFGEFEGDVYQIQEFRPGKKLYAVWKELDAWTQEAIVADLAAALKTLHNQKLTSFGLGREDAPTFACWPDFLQAKFQRTLDEIEMLKIRMAPGVVGAAAEYIQAHRQVLEGGTPTLVHGDLTLVNVLVHGGRLSAILDMEYSLQAPRDYELWVMEAFCIYPNDYAEEGNEVFCSADFANFCVLMRKHYPEVFETPHLRERLNLYQLDAALGSYLGWRKANLDTIPPERMAAKEFYMARIRNFLFPQGARMFFA